MGKNIMKNGTNTIKIKMTLYFFEIKTIYAKIKVRNLSPKGIN